MHVYRDYFSNNARERCPDRLEPRAIRAKIDEAIEIHRLFAVRKFYVGANYGSAVREFLHLEPGFAITDRLRSEGRRPGVLKMIYHRFNTCHHRFWSYDDDLELVLNAAIAILACPILP